MPSSKQRIQHTKPTVYQTIGLEKRGQLIKPNEATPKQLISLYLYNLESVHSSLMALDKEIALLRDEPIYALHYEEKKPLLDLMINTKKLFQNVLNDPLNTTAMAALQANLETYKKERKAPTFSTVLGVVSIAFGVILTALSCGLCALVMFGIGGGALLAAKMRPSTKVDVISKVKEASDKVSDAAKDHHQGYFPTEAVRNNYRIICQVKKRPKPQQPQPSRDFLISPRTAGLN